MNFVSFGAKPQAEIHVFEAIPELVIESTSLSKNTASHQHTRGRYNLEPPRFVHSRMAGGESGINMSRVSVLADYNAGMLDRIGGVKQFAAHNRSTRMVVCV